MANPEHLKILERGVTAWNDWLSVHWPLGIPENTDRNIDLSGSKLTNKDLRGAILDYADLSGANLSGSKLNGTFLGGADLTNADLSGADLSNGTLLNANLTFANLNGANLANADLDGADLSYAKLMGANLRGANLDHAKLSGADMTKADLTETDLRRVDIIRAILNKANVSQAKWGFTIICDLDLSEVIGLDTVVHDGPSSVGIDTLFKSQGKIPDRFLLDAGMPKEIIDIARSLRAGPAKQWHSCFISYSTKDEEFARRLYSRLREANMRVWFAPEDLEGGKKLHEQLFEAIQTNDRLLIVLSEHSIQSEWVMTEIRKAREVENKEKRRKLFPIRLTDFETLRDWTCFDADSGKDLAVEVREYFIPDFSNWKDHNVFETAFAQLKKDLGAENSKES